ncbi:hypothetical protein ElyMa_002210200 [Elysia marginata]|uniref:Uncharacterized protein n=1 Tax=Elysia marginata TaxID=1093978 RepID=A0AAV4FTG5_9GAST|nr:hypothetical protein ElyMa_002210200 [Elysia marginata]
MKKGARFECKKDGVHDHFKKCRSPTCNLTSNGAKLKQVSSFKYLGYTISSNGKCLPEVKRRIAVAKEAFFRMQPIMKSNTGSLSTLKLDYKDLCTDAKAGPSTKRPFIESKQQICGSCAEF